MPPRSLASRHPRALAACVAGLLIAAYLVALGPAGSSAQDANNKSPEGHTLEVSYYLTLGKSPGYALVHLFRGGKMMRSRQLSAGTTAASVTWTGLAEGEYEVHCSQIGYARSIYRILVSDKDVHKLTVKLDKEASPPVGGGPSYDELAAGLSAFNKAHTALENRLERRLEKQLKESVAALAAAARQPAGDPDKPNGVAFPATESPEVARAYATAHIVAEALRIGVIDPKRRSTPTSDVNRLVKEVYGAMK